VGSPAEGRTHSDQKPISSLRKSDT
jgi:hypothetical protein